MTQPQISLSLSTTIPRGVEVILGGPTKPMDVRPENRVMPVGTVV